MNLLNDILTYIRRIIKTPSNAEITDNLLIDYVNRFLLTDLSARLQLFDFKTKYQFQTTPGIDQYNMPLYSVQIEPGAQSIASFPVYQGFLAPVRVNGINIPLYTQTSNFYNLWPNYVQQQVQIGTGNGSSGPYSVNLPFFPALPGHVDLTGIIAYSNQFNTIQDPILVTNAQILANQPFIQTVPTTSVYSAVYLMATGANGQNIIVADSGEFLANNTDSDLYGLLMQPGNPPLGNLPLPNGYGGSFSITAIPNANPTVISAVGNFPTGVTIQISGVTGMTQLNGGTFTVLSSSPTTVTINIDSTLFGTYTGGGTITLLENVVNYNTGVISNVFFPEPIPAMTPISAQCYFYQTGIPRSILFFNNCLTLRPPPNTQYLVELEAYLSPAAFLTTSSAIPFGYMAEYIARGSARKILADTYDIEQFQFYEMLFKEQETLVHIRSQRQWTATRTDTIYSNSGFQSNYNQSSVGM